MQIGTQPSDSQQQLALLRKRLLKLHGILCRIDELTLKQQEIDQSIKDEMKRAYECRRPLSSQAQELGLKDKSNLVITHDLIARFEGSEVHVEKCLMAIALPTVEESKGVEGDRPKK